MVGLILAAGEGKRLFGDDVAGGCKPLVEVNGKRLLSYALDNLVLLGIRQAVIVVGKYADAIKNVYGDVYQGVQLTYAYQDKPNGIANAILSAETYIREDFVLQLSDEIFFGLKSCQDPFKGVMDFAVGFVEETDENKIKGNYTIDLDSKGTVLKCTEKPFAVTNHYKGTGFCFFRRETLNILKSFYDRDTNKPTDLCDFMNLLISKDNRGCIIKVADAEININTKQDLQQARLMIG